MKPRIFVSSTFYDLKSLREEMYYFIRQYGFEPIESETGDIGFIPWENLDASCYSTMKDCDMAILIIGGRYGSPKTGEVENDFEEYISVTREEFRTAVNNGIPIYAFIENKVFVEYELYKSNLNNPTLKDIIFRATDNINVFRFISEVYSFGTITVTPFNKNQEIKDYLQSQWSALFKKYMNTLRDEKRITSIEAAVSDMKTLIKKMNVMLDGVGKKILASGDSKEYEEVIELQNITAIASDISLYFELKEISYDDLEEQRRETITKLLIATFEALEKKLWGKLRSPKSSETGEFFDFYSEKGVALNSVGTYADKELSKLIIAFENEQVKALLINEMIKDEYYLDLIEEDEEIV